MDVCMAGRLLLPANTSWSQTGSAGDFVVQFEPLKGLAVFVGRAACVCTPLNTLQFCAPITSLDALIIAKQQGEVSHQLCKFVISAIRGRKYLTSPLTLPTFPGYGLGSTHSAALPMGLLPWLLRVPHVSVFVK